MHHRCRPTRSRTPRAPRLTLAALTAAALAAAPSLAQEAGPPPASPIAVGVARAGTLSEGAPLSYSIDLEAGSFVAGHAEQISVDVVVTVYDAEDKTVGKFDGPPRGPERFRFETQAAGRYRIEVAPFEGAAGEFEIVLDRVEPVATEPGSRVDQLMAAYAEAGVPGGVVAVVRNGEIAFAKAYGAANLTDSVPFAVDTRTNIGSTSKQFTAFAIALLAQRGQLSLDDDVRTHIPELPDLGETVTLRHLLSHTSGYREFLNTLILTGRRLDRGDSIDRAEIIEIVRRQPELQNSPGAEWNYNNTGYCLLAEVVARVTGTPFPEWMAANVFGPLGMHDTFVRVDSSIIERSAQGYVTAEAGRYLAARDLGASAGAGGIYTTVGDLAKWVRNFRTGELGGTSAFEQMTTPFVLTSGKPTDYGMGLFVDEHRGLRRIHHGGADLAHRSMLMYFPDLDAAVITLSNNAAFDGSIADSVADAFLGDAMRPRDAEPTAGAEFDPASFVPESFDALAGRYELEEMPGFILEFTRDGSRYFTQATGQPVIEIFPTSETSFRLDVVEASLTFHRDDEGHVGALTLHQNGDHPAKRVTEQAWAPTAEDLGGYTGRYYSEELETFYTIALEEGKLVLKHRRLDDVTLTPGKPHAFSGGMPVAQAAFEPDESGRIAALIVSNGRTRAVRFERVD